MRFYGRVEEIGALRALRTRTVKRGGAAMAVVTGRRRIGKTSLIRKALEDGETPYIYCFVNAYSDEAGVARELMRAAAQACRIEYPPAFGRLIDAVEYLLVLSRDRPMTIVFDECQVLDRTCPGFWSDLQRAWDLRKDGAKLLLVMSGSVQTMLERIFGGANEPLYGRADQIMRIRPFGTETLTKLFESEYPEGGMIELLKLYAMTGGVARYVELLVDSGVVHPDRMINFVFSESGSWFRDEGLILLANEFKIASTTAMTLLERIASGRTRWAEMQNGIEQPISAYVHRLEEQLGIIGRIMPALTKPQQKNARYEIRDPYFRFWLRFMAAADKQADIENKHWGRLIKATEAGMPAFLGRTLEAWFRRRFEENDRWSKVGAWWDRKGENKIDLVALDESSKELLVGECKLNPTKIDLDVVRLKAAAFLQTHPELQSWKLEVAGLSPEDMLRTC